MEIVLPYVCKGYVSKTMRFVEDWLRENWWEIKRIFLDTIIPEYNGRFYEKMGTKRLVKVNAYFKICN